MKLRIIFNIFILIGISFGKPKPTPKSTPKPKPQLGLPNFGGGSFGGTNNGFGGMDPGFGGMNNGFGSIDPGFGGTNNGFGDIDLGFGNPIRNPFNTNGGSAKQMLIQKLKEMLDILKSFDGGVGGPGGFLGSGTGFGTNQIRIEEEKKKKKK